MFEVPLECIPEASGVGRKSACMKVKLTGNMVSTVRKIIIWCDIRIKLDECTERTAILQICGKEPHYD